MEETKENIQEQQASKQSNKQQGNIVPNSFEELNAMRQSHNLKPYSNTIKKQLQHYPKMEIQFFNHQLNTNQRKIQ